MSSRHILEPDEDIVKPLIGNLSLFLDADDVLSSRESERAGRRGPETYVPFDKDVPGFSLRAEGRRIDLPRSINPARPRTPGIKENILLGLERDTIGKIDRQPESAAWDIRRTQVLNPSEVNATGLGREVDRPLSQ